MFSKDIGVLSYPKPNIDEYHGTYEFEIAIVENILNGEVEKALKLYEDFIRKNTIYNILDSKNIAYLKSYIVSISLLICHGVIKKGVSTYSVKAKYHAFSKLIERANSEVELIKIGKMMIKAYSTQLMHNKNSVDSICIRKAIDYIHDNLGEDISLDMVSDHVNLSRCYFCTKFKMETNMNFSTYITHTRIEKSK
ncbi:MAG: helix-turn-helix transcriptional regulator [Tissierella sp.]|nr:helix-turn-helix transcriptional regulator [Tissierella sp.]